MEKGLVGKISGMCQEWHSSNCMDEDICWPAFVKNTEYTSKKVILNVFDCRGYSHRIDLSKPEFDILSSVCGRDFNNSVFALHEYRTNPDLRRGEYVGISYSPVMQKNL